MNTIIICAVQLVAAIAAFLVGKYVFPEVKEYIPEVMENLAIIERWAEKFVRWAKEFRKDKPGEEKMDEVVKKLQEIAEKAGLDITEDQIRAIAQTAYDAMKAGEAEIATPLEAVAAVPAATVVINTTGTVATATDKVPADALEENPDGTVNVYDEEGNKTGTMSKEEAEAAASAISAVVIE